MPANDLFHEVVKEALKKDGWLILEEHYKLKYGKTKYYVDFAADNILAVQRNEEQILVEVKSFMGKSIANDYHEAIGKFRNYRLAIKLNNNPRTLFLAVPEDVYNDFFLEPFGQASIAEEALKLIVYNIEQKSIVAWIN